MTESNTLDVSAATFEMEVEQASFERPIVVDFWAPWCGPCRRLGPLLESLAAQSDDWQLAKVNVDENPTLAARFGVQGIPAVKGFRDGRVAAEFVGAQPEASVRAFLRRLLPGPADLAASEGRRLADAGDHSGAEAAFRRALADKQDHASALLGLGRLLAALGRGAEAEATLAQLLPGSPEANEAAPLLAQLRLAGAVESSPSRPRAEEMLRADPHDPAAHLALGQLLAADGSYKEALSHLLAVVERDRSYGDGAARAAMLAIFDVLGPDDPLTVEYRRKLASALYV